MGFKYDGDKDYAKFRQICLDNGHFDKNGKSPVPNLTTWYGTVIDLSYEEKVKSFKTRIFSKPASFKEFYQDLKARAISNGYGCSETNRPNKSCCNQ